MLRCKTCNDESCIGEVCDMCRNQFARQSQYDTRQTIGHMIEVFIQNDYNSIEINKWDYTGYKINPSQTLSFEVILKKQMNSSTRKNFHGSTLLEAMKKAYTEICNLSKDK